MSDFFATKGAGDDLVGLDGVSGDRGICLTLLMCVAGLRALIVPIFSKILTPSILAILTATAKWLLWG